MNDDERPLGVVNKPCDTHMTSPTSLRTYTHTNPTYSRILSSHFTKVVPTHAFFINFPLLHVSRLFLPPTSKYPTPTCVTTLQLYYSKI